MDEGMRQRLLREAGLEPINTAPSAGGVTPSKAWSLVVRNSVQPTAVIDDEDESYLSKVEAEWLRIANETAVIGADGTFLVSISGVNSTSLPWALVRLTEHCSAASTLVVNRGEPEFVTMATDGHSVCAVTTEEDGIWITSLDPQG